jgi:tRNA A-37 threonylcarbamoyl transferase component Bud32
MAATRILNDRYEVEGTVGRGGMATVYRGTDRVLGRTVAVKVLSEKYAGDEKFVTRFRREAQAAAALNHPNIVGVYDTGDEDEMHYIVMEFVEGETLADVLKREGPLDPTRAVAIAEDVATALEAAHDKGLVHRDVKPGNVMIDRDGRVKVMDFGIARAAADDTLTQTGLVLGTASYLSPEQAQGSQVDSRSDIYSLGCVLYEMLAGRPPFAGDSPVSIAYRHVNEDPRPPSDVAPSVPRELDAVVLRALAKEPDERFATAEEFRTALDAAMGGPDTAPIAAAGGDTDIMPAEAPAPPDERPARPARTWLPVALAAAAVVAVAGLLAISLAGEDPQAERQRDRQGEGGQEQPVEPTTPAPASVEEALGLFEDVVVEAVDAGQLTGEAGQKILEKGQAAGSKYFGGDLEGALGELGAAHEEVDKALAEGQLTSTEVGDALHQAIDLVAQAMQASPPATVPPDEEEEGDGDSEEGFVPPGQEKNKGKGKGKDEG